MILESIVASLVPSLIQGIGNVINKFTGGVQPQNVQDVIALKNADVEQLKALAALDSPGGVPSQWVIDLRGSFRYIAALVLIAAAVSTMLIPAISPLSGLATDMASGAFFFLFGDHVLSNFNKGTKK